MKQKKFSSHKIKKIYISCCYDELKVNKPGNLSKYSPIIGMSYKKFLRAAEISSEELSNKDNSIGEAIFKSCKNCVIQLDSNYNLGILLLCAPLIKVCLDGFYSLTDLKNKLFQKLDSVNTYDSDLIFEAIKLCNPGGLNNYDGQGNLLRKKNDNLNFKKLIEISSSWDRISMAYFNNYQEIFNLGLPLFRKLKKKFSTNYSIQCLYINYLALDLDSHIQRKYGKEKAYLIQKKTKQFEKILLSKEDKTSKLILFKFDNYLKKYFINPGTCADLTVTTLLINKIMDIVNYSNFKKF